MPRHAQIYRILVASPSDVKTERTIVTEVAAEWNANHSDGSGVMLEVVKWDTHARSEIGDHPQTIFNMRTVDSCDAVVGIFDIRIGTATPKAVSGTVEEIQRMIAAGKHAAVYFGRKKKDPFEIDATQLELVKAFRAEMRGKGIVFDFQDEAEFRKLLTADLSHLGEKWRAEAPQGIPASSPAGTGYDVSFEFEGGSERPRLDISILNRSRTNPIGIQQIDAMDGTGKAIVGRIVENGRMKKELRVVAPHLRTVVPLTYGAIAGRMKAHQLMNAQWLQIKMDHDVAPVVYKHDKIQMFFNMCRMHLGARQLEQEIAEYLRESGGGDDDSNWIN